MEDIIDLMKQAEVIYDLGVKMQQTFAKDESAKKHYMIMAIAAGLKEFKPPIPVSDIENLTKIRKQKGITLRQIEDATGISNSYLSQLENGKIKRPSNEVMVKLTNFIINGISDGEERGCFVPLVPGSGLIGF